MASNEEQNRILDIAKEFDFGEIELEPDELPDGAVLIIRTHRGDNCTRLIVRNTVGLDWVTLRGMISVTDQHIAESQSIFVGANDEEEGE